jgi:hypothetical protein
MLMRGLCIVLSLAAAAAAASVVPPSAVPPTLRGGVPGLGVAALRGGGPVLTRMEKRLFQNLSKGPGIYSADEPAELAGREDKHIPTLTITDAGAEVVVKHVMDDGADKVHHNNRTPFSHRSLAHRSLARIHPSTGKYRHIFMCSMLSRSMPASPRPLSRPLPSVDRTISERHLTTPRGLLAQLMELANIL